MHEVPKIYCKCHLYMTHIFSMKINHHDKKEEYFSSYGGI